MKLCICPICNGIILDTEPVKIVGKYVYHVWCYERLWLAERK